MNKNTELEIQLPPITIKNYRRPVTQLMAILKQKKKQLNRRIHKTQLIELDEESEENQIKQSGSQYKNDINVGQKLITQIPIYLNCRPKRNNSSNHIFQSFVQKSQSIVKQKQKTTVKLQSQSKPSAHSHLNMSNKQKSVVDRSEDNKTEKSLSLVIQNTNQIKQQQKIIEVVNTQRKIENVFLLTPVNPKARNEENTQPLKDYLAEKNMFFNKISPVVTLCIIKLNKLFIVQPKKTIFKIGEEIDSFFIILEGKLKLTNGESGFKKICSSGQTIFEEVLFGEGHRKLALQSAKTIGKTYLVEIKYQNFAKMKQEMIRYGYKLQFIQMESLIKRNFIMKNSLRAQKNKF